MQKLLLAAAALTASPLSAQQATTPAETAPATPRAATTTAPPPADVPARPAATAGAVAPAPATEVATIIAREFPAYDRNRDGALDQGEFGEWMVKLKTIADPASTANAAANKTWVNAAFAQADADKSRSLTLGELTGFLQRG